MSSAWRKLPGTLLKLVGRSSRTNVVSGDPSASNSDRAREATSWNSDIDGRNADGDLEKQEFASTAHDDPAASNDDRLHESKVQRSFEAAYAAQPPTQSPSASSANGQTTRGQNGQTDHPIRGHHRRTSSAASEVSLSSVMSTTGAYTGFTQHGKYDLTRDVILRGEFISEQQAKV